MLLIATTPPCGRSRCSSLFGVRFEEFLDFPLVRICAYKAQDFDGNERGGDEGDEEADAGPEGRVDKEGAVRDDGVHDDEVVVVYDRELRIFVEEFGCDRIWRRSPGYTKNPRFR